MSWSFWSWATKFPQKPTNSFIKASWSFRCYTAKISTTKKFQSTPVFNYFVLLVRIIRTSKFSWPKPAPANYKKILKVKKIQLSTFFAIWAKLRSKNLNRNQTSYLMFSVSSPYMRQLNKKSLHLSLQKIVRHCWCYLPQKMTTSYFWLAAYFTQS
jgi:hypothetical protein